MLGRVITLTVFPMAVAWFSPTWKETNAVTAIVLTISACSAAKVGAIQTFVELIIP